jgi:hypothetical protein
VDGETEYHDISADPCEMNNTVGSLSSTTVTQYQAAVAAMKACKGTAACWAAQHMERTAARPRPSRQCSRRWRAMGGVRRPDPARRKRAGRRRDRGYTGRAFCLVCRDRALESEETNSACEVARRWQQLTAQEGVRMNQNTEASATPVTAQAQREPAWPHVAGDENKPAGNPSVPAGPIPEPGESSKSASPAESPSKPPEQKSKRPARSS